ncbi:cyclophilin-like fold protein [Eisenbergiella sp.]
MQKEVVSEADEIESTVTESTTQERAELPFTPFFDETRTSEIKAGHVNYWDAFVMNYIDYDISPYKVVHIGKITDQSVVDVLTSAEEQVTIQITE